MLKCCTCFGSSRWSETQLHSYDMFGRNCVGRLAGWLFLHTYEYEWKNRDGCKYYGDLKVARQSSLYHPSTTLTDGSLRMTHLYVLCCFFSFRFVFLWVAIYGWIDGRIDRHRVTYGRTFGWDYHMTTMTHLWATFELLLWHSRVFFISICTWHSHCGAS